MISADSRRFVGQSASGPNPLSTTKIESCGADLAAGLSEGKVSQFIQDQESEAGDQVGVRPCRSARASDRLSNACAHIVSFALNRLKHGS